MKYVAPKVSLFPNASMATKASSCGRSLEEFRFEEELSTAIKVSRVEAWAATPSQETKSASSVASSSFSSKKKKKKKKKNKKKKYSPSGANGAIIQGLENVLRGQ